MSLNQFLHGYLYHLQSKQVGVAGLAMSQIADGLRYLKSMGWYYTLNIPKLCFNADNTVMFEDFTQTYHMYDISISPLNFINFFIESSNERLIYAFFNLYKYINPQLETDATIDLIADLYDDLFLSNYKVIIGSHELPTFRESRNDPLLASSIQPPQYDSIQETSTSNTQTNTQ
ncbi:hypothetical protein BDF19DRAFT_434673 [Syncephalis fuscata]|nr:hypothetical protein BDF19DRAFT_434673 [Syncephalis fuscata]